jgi:MoxR-like ATPase
VSAEEEVAILTALSGAHPLDRLAPCASVTEVLAARAALASIRVSDEIKRYVVELVAATRTAADVRLGASPRASLALMKLGQALAASDGLEFVTPDHVQEIAADVIAHRLVLDTQRRFAGGSARDVVDQILRTTPVPH